MNIDLTTNARHNTWLSFITGKPGDLYVGPSGVYVFIEKYVDDSGPIGYEYIHYMFHNFNGTSSDSTTRLGEAY